MIKLNNRYGPWIEKYLSARRGEWFTSTQLNDYSAEIFPGNMRNYINLFQIMALLMALYRGGVLKMEKRRPRGLTHKLCFWQYPAVE